MQKSKTKRKDPGSYTVRKPVLLEDHSEGKEIRLTSTFLWNEPVTKQHLLELLAQAKSFALPYKLAKFETSYQESVKGADGTVEKRRWDRVVYGLFVEAKFSDEYGYVKENKEMDTQRKDWSGLWRR